MQCSGGATQNIVNENTPGRDLEGLIEFHNLDPQPYHFKEAVQKTHQRICRRRGINRPAMTLD